MKCMTEIRNVVKWTSSRSVRTSFYCFKHLPNLYNVKYGLSFLCVFVFFLTIILLGGKCHASQMAL